MLEQPLGNCLNIQEKRTFKEEAQFNKKAIQMGNGEAENNNSLMGIRPVYMSSFFTLWGFLKY